MDTPPLFVPIIQRATTIVLPVCFPGENRLKGSTLKGKNLLQVEHKKEWIPFEKGEKKGK